MLGQIGRNHIGDLRISSSGLLLHKQDDGLCLLRNLNGPQGNAFGNHLSFVVWRNRLRLRVEVPCGWNLQLRDTYSRKTAAVMIRETNHSVGLK